MSMRYRDIRDRYADEPCGFTERQMRADIQALLHYIDRLHQAMARQAAQHLVTEAFESFGTAGGTRTATH
ncbi:MAG: hypothetical protein SCH98_03270 [Deferrisomatales bacterium]|nr:hypothetical protein [Deferrisomatales bacterium]